MKRKTSSTLLLAASLLLALSAVPAFAAAPGAPTTVAPAAAPSTPSAVEAPTAQNETPDLPILPLFAPRAEPTVGGGCGAKHTLEYAIFLTSIDGCDAQCTSWCDGLGGRVTSTFWGRGECDCFCCV